MVRVIASKPGIAVIRTDDAARTHIWAAAFVAFGSTKQRFELARKRLEIRALDGEIMQGLDSICRDVEFAREGGFNLTWTCCRNADT
jgi:DNA-binding transcriptional regulator WhiA